MLEPTPGTGTITLQTCTLHLAHPARITFEQESDKPERGTRPLHVPIIRLHLRPPSERRILHPAVPRLRVLSLDIPLFASFAAPSESDD